MSQEERTGGNSNKCPGSEPSLLLVNGDLWEKFHRADNEMIITKSGRCLFPLLQFKAVDLDPGTMYSIDVDFEMLDRRRYRYVDGTWKCSQSCKKSASDDEEDENENDDGDGGSNHFPRGLQEFYTHPDLCQLGAHWMQKTISFSKIKLTNKIPEAVVKTQKRSKDLPATNSHIFHLTSFHRYRPRVHLVQRSSQRRSVIASTTFTFDRTAFMAVTHYQNFKVNDLKKGHNPHAKGFRDTIQYSPSGPRSVSSSFDPSRIIQRSKRSRSSPRSDSGSEDDSTVKDEDDNETGISDVDMKHDPLLLDGSNSRVVTHSRAKHVIDDNNTIATIREVDGKAIKVEILQQSLGTALRLSTSDPEESRDIEERALLTATQPAQTPLGSSLYEMVPLTFRQRSRPRPLSQKAKASPTLHAENPSNITRSRRAQPHTEYRAVTNGASLHRQPYVAADFQMSDMLQLAAPMTPMPEPTLSSELQLSPPSKGNPVSGYEPRASEAAVHPPTGTVASSTTPTTSWYQQFFNWDQPSPSLTLPPRSSNILSIQGPCLVDSSSSLPLQLQSGQSGQVSSQQGLLGGTNAQNDIQSVPSSLDADTSLISEPFSGPSERAIPCMAGLPAFAYDDDRLAFDYTQADTCHIWPTILESKTMMSTSPVFSVLPYYDEPQQMNLDMVLQENLRLKAFIRERYGRYCKQAIPV